MTEARCIAGHPWSMLMDRCERSGCTEVQDQPPADDEIMARMSGFTLGRDVGMKLNHENDRDCAAFLVDDECTICGVVHMDPCGTCKGRGYHEISCPDSD